MADLTLPQPDDTRDPKLFGNVSPFDPQLFQSADECGDNLITGRATGKYSPLEVAQWLEDIATAAWSQLETAHVQLRVSVSTPASSAALRRMCSFNEASRYFLAKLRSAVLWRLYVITGYDAAGDAAIARYTEGRDAWAAMATRAGGVYRSNISFGAERLQGHWLDRIPAFDADIADLHRRRATPLAPTRRVDQADAERALNIACAPKPHVRPTLTAEHTPAGGFRPVAGDCPALLGSISAACRTSLSPRRPSGTLAVVRPEGSRRHFLRRDSRRLYGQALSIAVLFSDRDRRDRLPFTRRSPPILRTYLITLYAAHRDGCGVENNVC